MTDDLRLPIGMFFLIVGTILLITGFTGSSRALLGPEDVNIYCGVSMAVFGSVMLWLARRAR